MKYIKALYPLVAVGGLLLLAACSGQEGSGARAEKDSTVTVTLALPEVQAASGVSATGQVESVQSAAVGTRLMGVITHVYVKQGDRVRAGQLLAVVGSPDLSARKAQADAAIEGARADLDNARKEYDRFSRLFARQSATASELDNATLRYNAAQSRLDAAMQVRNEVSATIGYAQVTAPFAGTVTQKMAEEGGMATPGAPLFTVESSGRLQVSALIAESDIGRVKAGDKAHIVIGSVGVGTEGVVLRINPSSAATGSQYTATIGLPADAQKGLYAGMYANVFIPVHAMAPPAAGGDAVLVPVSALVQNDQLSGLYTVGSMHTALLRWVRTGRRYGDKIEILSGLGREEPFVASADGRLYDGVPVRTK